jgi:hypothetical protein
MPYRKQIIMPLWITAIPLKFERSAHEMFKAVQHFQLRNPDLQRKATVQDLHQKID